MIFPVTDNIADPAPARDIRADVLLLELVSKITSSTDEEQLFAGVTEGLRALFAAARVSVCLVDEAAPDVLRIVKVDGERAIAPAGMTMSTRDTLAGRAVQTMQTQFATVLDSTAVDVGPMATVGIVEVVAAPVVIGERCIGTLNAAFSEPTAGAAEIFDHAARLVARHLDRMAAHEALARQTESLECLHEVERRLSMAMSLDEIIEVLSDTIVDLVDAARVSFARVGPGPARVHTARRPWDGSDSSWNNNSTRPRTLP